MARRYASIWKELKLKGKAVVRCKTAKIPTIVQGVKKEKSRENTINKSLNLQTWGELEIKRFPEKGEIHFRQTLRAVAEDL